MTITVKYTCNGCAITKADVLVPARGTEDVGTWMGVVAQLVADDHARRSPMCSSRTCDLMIPHDTHNAKARVGDPKAN